MAKTKTPRRSPRPRRNGRRRITGWVSDETASLLTVYAAHRQVKYGVIIEEAIKQLLSGSFYVVDRTTGPQLGVVGGTEGESAAS
jgi:hypothetical protein